MLPVLVHTVVITEQAPWHSVSYLILAVDDTYVCMY